MLIAMDTQISPGEELVRKEGNECLWRKKSLWNFWFKNRIFAIYFLTHHEFFAAALFAWLELERQVKIEGNKAAKFLGELFKFQGPTPKNYIPVSRSSFISADQFKSIPIQKNRKPNLELKLLP